MSSTNRFVARQEPVHARPLVTVRMEGDRTLPAGIEGALVRLYPTVQATDTEIAAVRAALEKAGALSVRTMPKPSAGTVVKKSAASSETHHRTTRQVVADMVHESTASDQGALIQVCGDIMNEIGI